MSSLRDSLEFDISSDEWQSAATADQPHVLAASVLDAAGKTLIAATPVRFYVQRATVRKRVGPR